MSNQVPPVYPPLDGSISYASLVDFHAAHNPTLPIFVYSEIPGSVVEVSFLEFGRAAHRVAHILQGKEGEVVALIANVDNLLYQTLFAGIMCAGLVVCPFLATDLKQLSKYHDCVAIPNLSAQLASGHSFAPSEDCLHAHSHHIFLSRRSNLPDYHMYLMQGRGGPYYLAVLPFSRTRNALRGICAISRVTRGA